MQLAKGKYIANMDADDISLPTRLEKQFTFLEKNPDVAVIASKLVLINQNNDEIGIWPEDYHISDRNEIRKVLPIINCIGQPTVMIKNSVMKEIGYNTKYINGIEDWGLWLDILSRHLGFN